MVGIKNWAWWGCDWKEKGKGRGEGGVKAKHHLNNMLFGRYTPI
jgi:hypothetical protein